MISSATPSTSELAFRIDRNRETRQKCRKLGLMPTFYTHETGFEPLRMVSFECRSSGNYVGVSAARNASGWLDGFQAGRSHQTTRISNALWEVA